MPRATPIHDKSQVPAEAQSVAEDVLSVFGRIRGPFSVFLNSPNLAEQDAGAWSSSIAAIASSASRGLALAR